MTYRNKDFCEHVGKKHPREFQCTDCYDNACDCNCFSCMGVFCDNCEEILPIECSDVIDAWDKEHPQSFQLGEKRELKEK